MDLLCGDVELVCLIVHPIAAHTRQKLQAHHHLVGEMVQPLRDPVPEAPPCRSEATQEPCSQDTSTTTRAMLIARP